MDEQQRRLTIDQTLSQADPEQRVLIERSMEAARPVVEELRKIGYPIETLADLRHLGRNWKTALPVLLNWLPQIDDPDIKEEIVRCLSVPWVDKTATALLIEEFRKAAVNNPMLAWTIGNALSIINVAGFESEILALVRNRDWGMSRQMLVQGLGRFRDAESEATAIELLADDSVRLHAIAALGAMKSRQALPVLEKLLTDKKAAVRKEARSAIAKITR